MVDQTLEVKFKINDQFLSLAIPVGGSDSDHLFKITNDDEYTLNYIKELINSGFLSLNEAFETLRRVDDDGSEIPIYDTHEENEVKVVNVDASANNNDTEENEAHNSASNTNNEWNNQDTSKLLDLYEQYLPLVAPLKKFKTKKVMWNKIAEILNSNYHTTRTGIQVENRYKTVLKRKKNAVDNNKTSGAIRLDIPFESELNKIASIDDSIEPEVTGTAKGINVRKTKVLSADVLDRPSTSSDCSLTLSDKSCSSSAVPRKRVKTIQETLMEIQEKREAAKERRHKEKIELLKTLFSNNNNSEYSAE